MPVPLDEMTSVADATIVHSSGDGDAALMPDVGRFLAACKGREPRVFHVLQHVCRPLLANLLRQFDNKQFHEVKPTSKLLSEAHDAIGPSVLSQLMCAIGFIRNGGSVESRWVFQGSLDRAVVAERWLSSVEDALRGVVAGHAASSSPATAEDDILFKSLSKAGENRRKKAEDDRRAEVEHLRLKGLQEARERAERERNEQAAQLALQQGLRQDFEDAAHLEETARSTLHNTGRHRNASFSAKHFQLRVMRHGRSFACNTCDDACIEVHWHVVSGSLLYAYCVHMSPDATRILHTGYEHAYQYNTIPGTDHFRRTIWMTTKHVNEETGLIDLLQHHTKPVDRCIYCNELFRTLFL